MNSHWHFVLWLQRVAIMNLCWRLCFNALMTCSEPSKPADNLNQAHRPRPYPPCSPQSVSPRNKLEPLEVTQKASSAVKINDTPGSMFLQWSQRNISMSPQTWESYDQVSHNITPIIESKHISQSVKLSWCSKLHFISSLVDSGVAGKFIDQTTAEMLSFPLVPLTCSLH